MQGRLLFLGTFGVNLRRLRGLSLTLGDPSGPTRGNGREKSRNHGYVIQRKPKVSIWEPPSAFPIRLVSGDIGKGQEERDDSPGNRGDSPLEPYGPDFPPHLHRRGHGCEGRCECEIQVGPYLIGRDDGGTRDIVDFTGVVSVTCSEPNSYGVRRDQEGCRTGCGILRLDGLSPVLMGRRHRDGRVHTKARLIPWVVKS